MENSSRIFIRYSSVLTCTRHPSLHGKEKAQRTINLYFVYFSTKFAFYIVSFSSAKVPHSFVCRRLRLISASVKKPNAKNIYHPHRERPPNVNGAETIFNRFAFCSSIYLIEPPGKCEQFFFSASWF